MRDEGGEMRDGKVVAELARQESSKLEGGSSPLKIVGFLCTWCSYAGADLAGSSRLTYPTDIHIVRIPCTGRIDPLFVVRALISGADGVLVSGCHPNDCHYREGNFYARRRFEVLKHFLPFMGFEEERFRYVWISASEGQKWRQVVTEFVGQIRELGPIKTEVR